MDNTEKTDKANGADGAGITETNDDAAVSGADEKDAFSAAFLAAGAAADGSANVGAGDTVSVLTEACRLWRARAEAAEARIRERETDDAIERGLKNVRFSSEAARRDIVSRIKSAGFVPEDGKLPGLDEFLENERRVDAAAFADGRAKVRFTDDMSAQRDGTVDAAEARSRIMAIKDRAERRAAIAENMDLFRK